MCERAQILFCIESRTKHFRQAQTKICHSTVMVVSARVADVDGDIFHANTHLWTFAHTDFWHCVQKYLCEFYLISQCGNMNRNVWHVYLHI